MAETPVGLLDMARRIFGYLNKYPKRGYSINPQPLTINADYEKVHMKYYFGNQYAYFNEDIYGWFPEPLLDELDNHLFVVSDYGNNKITGRSITGLFSVV